MFDQVPGAYELPFAARSLIENDQQLDAIIALGCLIKGETPHFDYISSSVAQTLQQVSQKTGIPVIFGVLTVLTESQALVRAGLQSSGSQSHAHNHGVDYAQAAVKMSRFAFRKRYKQIQSKL